MQKIRFVSHLRHAASNLQQLVTELSENLWDKATDQERHFPTQKFSPTPALTIPAVPEANRSTTNYTPASIDNEPCILDGPVVSFGSDRT